jgi:dTDP-4-amino-4,6-dideoxygalactose transaminase
MDKLAIHGGNPVRTERLDNRPAVAPREKELVMEVLDSRHLCAIDGPMAAKFEENFAEYVGARHAIATDTGTAALHISLAASGVGPGDEVIVPAYTFIASSTSILHNNAIPVFCDIMPDTFCLDPEDVRKRITDKTRAIMPVHLFGHPAEMDEIMEIAEDRDLKVVEDCAQAHASEYKGKKVGSIGDLGCFSFQESKNMTAGEGGLVVTDDDDLADACRRMRHHGEAFGPSASRTYESFSIGYNFRMTELAGAVLLAQLEMLDEFTARRIRNGDRLVRDLSEFDWITVPVKRPYAKHVYHVFVLRIDEDKLGMTRSDLHAAYTAEGLYAGFGYSRPLYMNPIFRNKVGFGDKDCPYGCQYYGGSVKYEEGLCPVTEQITRDALWIGGGWTIHNIAEADMDDIVHAFQKIDAYAKSQS